MRVAVFNSSSASSASHSPRERGQIRDQGGVGRRAVTHQWRQRGHFVRLLQREVSEAMTGKAAGGRRLRGILL